MSDAKALIKLQEIDLDILRMAKSLSDMPQLDARKKVTAKLQEVEAKSQQISAMRSNSELEMQKLIDEDSALVEKANMLEEEIKNTTDFRVVTNLTRELEGIAKRRNKVEFDHNVLAERVGKISAVEDQIADALKKLNNKLSAIDEEIANIKEEIDAKLEKAKSARAKTESLISIDFIEQYERLRKTKSGIAVGVLQENHCSVCRVELPEGKLVKLQSGPEINTCPQCRRILIIEKD